MSHYSKIFNKLPVQVPNKSGFDKSFENLLTGRCGTLVPVLCDEMLPGDTISLGAMAQFQLPPMATDFFGRVDVRFEAFVVPMRLLYGGFQSWAANLEDDEYLEPVSPYLPNGAFYFGGVNASIKNPGIGDYYGVMPQSLMDYLGMKTVNEEFSDAYSVEGVNLLPFLAYHLIWNDWYRDSRIQKPCFTYKDVPKDGSFGLAARLPHHSFEPDSDATLDGLDIDSSDPFILYDGVSLFDLRQRNWSKDYFTSASLAPQSGSEPQSVKFDVKDSSGSFTIAALRQANAIQQWRERNNLAGQRYYDQIKARFGVTPSDANFQRPIYLGSATLNVYNRSVLQTANNSKTDSTSSKNPFKTVGARYANSSALGDFSLIDKFTATEYCYVMVLASLVPHAQYGSGCRRYLFRDKLTSMPDPYFAGIGDQAILLRELTSDVTQTGIFGYTDYAAEHKYHDDEVHGLLRDRDTLQSFALQRSFSNSLPSLSSDFLQIPTTFLSQVKAVSDAGADSFDYWADIFFSYKLSTCLPVYSIPTLENIKNTHNEFVSRGGTRL